MVRRQGSFGPNPIVSGRGRPRRGRRGGQWEFSHTHAWALSAFVLAATGLYINSTQQLKLTVEGPGQAAFQSGSTGRQHPPKHGSYATCHSRYAGNTLAERLASEGRGLRSFVSVLPPPWERPFKCRAVVSLLSSETGNNTENDFYFLSLALLMHRLSIDPELKLPDDVEAAVVAIPGTDQAKIELLIDMGVRVFLVDPILREGGAPALWKHCYSKLYLFQMTFYRHVAFVDADMFPVGKVVGPGGDTIFQTVEEAGRKDPGRYLFAGVQDIGFAPGHFNAGMFVLEPNEDHYSKLRMLVPYTDLYQSAWMEQGLLNYYFSDRPDCPGGVPWLRMSHRYNAAVLEVYERVERERLVLIHGKPWRSRPKEDERTLAVWAKAMDRLQEWDRSMHNVSIVAAAMSP